MAHGHHGGHVYPFFVAKVLRQSGIECHEVILDDGIAVAGGSRNDMPRVGWFRLGPIDLPGLSAVLRLVVRRLAARLKKGRARSELARCERWLARVGVRASAKRRSALVILIDGQATASRILDPGKVSSSFGVPVALFTHDVISARTAALAGSGLALDFQAMDGESEASLLNAASIVSCISDDDNALFAGLGVNSSIVTCFPPIYQSNPFRKPTSQVDKDPVRFLFIGGGGVHNRYGVSWLLDELWPGDQASVQLFIAGGICRHLTSHDIPGNVSLLGYLDKVDLAYQDADVAIVAVPVGSGVKMKLLEAVHFQCPVISTEEGLRGFPVSARGVVPTFNDRDGFVGLVNELSDHNQRQALSYQQWEWAERELDAAQLVSPLADALLNAAAAPDGTQGE